MVGLAIPQQHNTQEAIFHFRHLRPPSNSAIGLDSLPNWRLDGALDPFLSDNSPIRPVSDCLEVACDLRAANVADFRVAGLSCRNVVLAGFHGLHRRA
jgi:hypothetical protein